MDIPVCLTHSTFEIPCVLYAENVANLLKTDTFEEMRTDIFIMADYQKFRKAR